MPRERSPMSMRKIFALAVALGIGAGVTSAAEIPKLGKPISEGDLKAWDISIAPDGVGLPAGSGTPAQGATVFAAKCAACHGAKGEGGAGPRPGRRAGAAAPPPPPGPEGGVHLPAAATGVDFLVRAHPWGWAQTA